MSKLDYIGLNYLDFEAEGKNKPIYNKNKSIFEDAVRKKFGNRYDILIDYLSESDYFYTPAAAKYHDNHPGGLYNHCMKLYGTLDYYNKYLGNKWSEDTVFLVSFCHDLCKLGLYKMQVLSQYEDKDNGLITDYGYSYNDLGYDNKVIHGTKSLEILGNIGLPDEFITEELCYSIVYHMGVWTLDAPDYKSALEKYDLVFFTHSADMLSSRSSESICKISVNGKKQVIIE